MALFRFFKTTLTGSLNLVDCTLPALCFANLCSKSLVQPV
jgi:hypothetical protein